MAPRATCLSRKRVASQSFTVPSALAEARCRPSPLTASPRISRGSWGAERADLMAGPRVPHPYHPTRSPRDQVVAVVAEGHRERLGARRERVGRPAGPGVPDRDDKQLPLVIPTGGGDQLQPSGCQATQKTTFLRPATPTLTRPVGTSQIRTAASGRPGRGECLPRRGEARRGNPPAVRADRHAPDFTGVLMESEDFLMSFAPLQRHRIPEPDGRVPAARGEAAAVGAEGHAQAHIDVSAEVEYVPAGCCLPYAHRLVFAA